jgi:hypothetical protein
VSARTLCQQPADTEGQQLRHLIQATACSACTLQARLRPSQLRAVAWYHFAKLELATQAMHACPNVAFIANLMNAGVEFLACDQPFASRLTLHILAAVAEDEARRISERTKAALQAAKARGRSSGVPLPPRP